MIICESEFDKPDPKDPRYAQHEVDVYGYCPPRRDHRLSIRKNLITGKIEAYRSYGKDKIEVVFESTNLGLVIDFTNAEYLKYCKSELGDQACNHDTVRAEHCSINQSSH